ncbi:GNAT family N-acetyltransferase [Halomonas sp. SpR8]|uniref:GNAT family N-acetyltransferase n=1 Tax=Halomonas sp. SpR8 TaxID=3050463 RepID=UPI0027E59C51|nr:GNAT family N-acetyltransferase [Halomonas sp. SpR8]MDQ7729943.1 GNAT family N-acetyltransferase [Halomonas sp. SpR8]
MNVRTPKELEVDQLAKIWYDGWQDAHSKILPPELARYRTLESFKDRLRSALPDVRVSGPDGQPLGFSMTKDDELYQLYVATESRGSGLAVALLEDAEERIGALGFQTAWLACGIGNERAAKFYEKNGWECAGKMLSELPTPDGPFTLEVWRYEKKLNGLRPRVSIVHVVLETDRMEETSRFMRMVGMRSIFDGSDVSVYEMRGGTHLIMMRKDSVVGGNASFDLMVDDLRTTHKRFVAAGLDPSPIEARPTIDHEVFTLQEPAGHVITFFSSHASGKPI